MRLPTLALLAACAPFAFADFTVVSPAAGSSVIAGQPITVTLVDSQAAPQLSLFSTYSLILVQGGQTEGDGQFVVTTFGNNLPVTQLSVTGTIPIGATGPLTNSFFWKIQLVATEGGTYVDWSNRFSVTGLTGAVPPAVATAMTAIGAGTAGPAPVNNLNQNGGAGGLAEWSIPYNLQTGLTKWAPMQPIPPTKITEQAYTPLFPTSAYTLATTWLPSPSIVTTVTQAQTFSVSSYENPAAPAGQPTQSPWQSSADVVNYLRRWAD